ncbi:MAG: hypothetical protein COV67_15615 [Nitrospinae bacterium CG11_big_fil_rev_8_21_14_0_20_56_8]|nr:MAG: hypothetical protein COV67_15615 [Nitrospinae bacterium CG11_big_fil_rev_8_21_14_0_20_56_8]
MAHRERFNRKVLKEPDQFLSLSDRVVHYMSDHQPAIVTGIVLLFIVFAGGLGYHFYTKSMADSMEARLYQMEKVQQTALDENKSLKDLLPQLETQYSEISGESYKNRAALILADALYRIQNYDKAMQYYQEILDRSGEDQIIHQAAHAGLAYSLEGKKEYKKASDTYKVIIEQTSDIPKFHLYFSLARTYALSGDTNGALQTLREMKTRFAGHSQIDRVDQEIEKLQAKA